MTIDMRKYGGENFITVADVRDGPIQVKIVDAKEGRYDKPDLIFETDDVLSLNATNRKALMRAYGFSATWVGKIVELAFGEVKFQNKLREAVVVNPISPPLTADERMAKPAAGDGDTDDSIPF